jgi:hypothetical protein
MNTMHRIGSATLFASLLGLSGCPSEHRGEERRDVPSAEQRRPDSRDERREPAREPARDDSRDQRRDPADNRPR